MSQTELLTFLSAVALFIVALCCGLYFIFYRFLEKERRKAEAFRGANDDPAKKTKD